MSVYEIVDNLDNSIIAVLYYPNLSKYANLIRDDFRSMNISCRVRIRPIKYKRTIFDGE